MTKKVGLEVPLVPYTKQGVIEENIIDMEKLFQKILWKKKILYRNLQQQPLF